MEKLRDEKASSWNLPATVDLRAFYNGQKLFYARQAIYIITQIPTLVSDTEYNTVARAFADAGDDEEALRYCEKAIAAAPSDYYKALNIRSYAGILVRSGQLELGRQKYEEAIKLVGGNTDNALWFRGETLQRWARIESMRGDQASADELFNRAHAEYTTIDFLPRQREGLANLQAIREKKTMPEKLNLAAEESTHK